MLGNRIESILNSSTSFGKLNVILYFEVLQIYFEVIYKDIINLFKPDEVRCSLFDLDNMEMRDIEFAALSNQNNNSILRIVLIGEKEEIIIEYYQSQVIIEHLFRSDNINVLRGYSIIEKYKKEKQSSILVVGYELSIDINSFESSLRDNVSDKSLYPIVLVKSDINNNCLIEEFISDNSKVNEQKVEIMKEYLKLISISSVCR
jgi:hypothetical protein